ncbi:MAG: type I phosphomannose isomerase catalytic subunit [Phycisphaerae bacterium]
MEIYPLKFKPVYKEKIWGGRNLHRLFGRDLPEDKKIGESWELADLPNGQSVVSNGVHEGKTLNEVTNSLGVQLMGKAATLPDGRFPLLLKLLDANDRLSLQVHPDEKAAQEIPGAELKTECWFMVESRGGYIYKGVRKGVTPAEFRHAIETDSCEDVVRRIDCETGDFHYLPAGTVHAIGPGLVVAEVQTPSDTTYRVTDWGRGREIHVDRSMECIRFDLTGDEVPGAEGDCLLVTDYFTVFDRTIAAGSESTVRESTCAAMMMLSGTVQIQAEGIDPVEAGSGDTVLLPAALEPTLSAESDARFLFVTLPEKS